MFKFIGKTLAGVVLTKDAQAAVGKALTPKPEAAAKPSRPAATVNKAASAARPAAKGTVSAARQALIRNALKVRAEQQKVIPELTDEQRATLVGITLIGFLKADQQQK